MWFLILVFSDKLFSKSSSYGGWLGRDLGWVPTRQPDLSLPEREADESDKIA